MQKGHALALVLVGILLLVTVAGGALYFQKTHSPSSTTSPAPSKNEVCVQVITPAWNFRTAECKEFGTPCDVPSGWETVNSCEDIRNAVPGTLRLKVLLSDCKITPCSEKPYQATIIIKNSDGSKEVKRVTSDSNGKIEIGLPPGGYTMMSAEKENERIYSKEGFITIRPREIIDTLFFFIKKSQ